MDNGLQLEMNFELGINRFRNCLDNGVFSLLIETNAPALDTELGNAVNRLLELEKAVASVSAFPVGLAITDKWPYPNSWNVIDFIRKLPAERRDRHVIYLSGADTSAKDLFNTVKVCVGEGFQNVVPVSGSVRPDDNERDVRKRNYVESVNILDSLRREPVRQVFPGCVVNPFKYTRGSSFAQYYKLIRKLNLGASFMVAQLGWDMAKLQELRWYLSWRGLYYPSVARLCMLTPERVEKILRGDSPGIIIPESFRRILESESRFSLNQFEAAQWRRLQLHVAGCKMLGYSGVQIAGVDTPEKLNVVVRRISSALSEFDNFQQWLAAYREHLGQLDMSPYPYSFYVFEKLLSHPFPVQEFPKMRHSGDPVVGGWEKFGYAVREFMFAQAHEQAPNERIAMKKMLAGCRSCSVCRLPMTMYVCPEKCPKGMANGPCGGTRPNGDCELPGQGECVHLRIARTAVWRNEVDMLEDGCLEQSPRFEKK